MRTPGTGIGLAIAATAATALVRWGLDPLLENTSQFLLYYFTVTLVAVARGTKSGVWATVLGAIAGTVYFVAADHVGPSWMDDAARLGFFLLFGAMASALAGPLRDARDQAAARAGELARYAESLRRSEERFRLAIAATRSVV